MSSSKASPAQILYANILFWGGWSALALLFLTFLIYVFGILDPYVPMDQITQLWQGSSHHYVEAANIPVGWNWLALLGKGDFLNFIGIVILAGLTIVCMVPLIPMFLKDKQPVFAVIAFLEILVLVLAASGIVGGGAH